MAISSKDNFSGHADIYAKYRPLYPPELYEFILQNVPAKDAALDCGTGNSQAAGVLADYFTEVQATDISKEQLKKAVQKPNLHYHICHAEETPFADNSFDLVTSATAAHWFKFDQFYNELKRIGRNNAVFACWAYDLLRTDQLTLNELIDIFYYKKMYDYWDVERRHVEKEYKTLPFPLQEIKSPGFTTRLRWDIDTLEGYLNTWSAVQHFIKKNGVNPVTEFMHDIRKKFGSEQQFEIAFPIFMRIGIIKK
jgi:SAM-dependent methyltransferase